MVQGVRRQVKDFVNRCKFSLNQVFWGQANLSEKAKDRDRFSVVIADTQSCREMCNIIEMDSLPELG